jgi:hypothetical protein
LIKSGGSLSTFVTAGCCCASDAIFAVMLLEVVELELLVGCVVDVGLGFCRLGRGEEIGESGCSEAVEGGVDIVCCQEGRGNLSLGKSR